MDPSVMTVAIIAAALVIKTAALEIRNPGTARREWAFVTDSMALAAGSVTAVAVRHGGMGAAGRSAGGPGDGTTLDELICRAF